MRKNQFLKVKNNLLELDKDFIELKDRELNNRKLKIKREIEVQLFEPFIVSRDDMNKFEENKTNWKHWLINYIPEPVAKIVGGFKKKNWNFFNTNTPKQIVYGRGK